jgi:hypothetical protein
MDDIVGVGMMDTGVFSTRMLTLVCARLFSGRSATITTDARLQGPSSNVVATAKPEAQVHHLIGRLASYHIICHSSRAIPSGAKPVAPSAEEPRSMLETWSCVFVERTTHRRRSSEAARREPAHDPCQYSHWWKDRTHLASMNGSKQYWGGAVSHRPAGEGNKATFHCNPFALPNFCGFRMEGAL